MMARAPIPISAPTSPRLLFKSKRSSIFVLWPNVSLYKGTLVTTLKFCLKLRQFNLISRPVLGPIISASRVSVDARRDIHRNDLFWGCYSKKKGDQIHSSVYGKSLNHQYYIVHTPHRLKQYPSFFFRI